VTIVDTMGGINLRMGNYEHTPHDRMWDAVGLTGDKNWVVGLPPNPDGAPVTEGQKDKWAQRMAIEYMLSHPAQTIRRSFIKFSDFWGLEREFIAGVQAGFFSPPVWFHVAATIAIILGYVVVVTMGALGLWIAPPADRRMQVLMLLPIVLITGLHTVVFGHSRYHVPLMPLFGVYAAAFVTERWRAVRSVAAGPKGPALLPITGALATVTTLVAVWVRQVVVVDLARISALFNHAG
jgi:hypothetical protein